MCAQINWIKPSRNASPASADAHTHTQVLVTQKPAGGCNNAKAHIPKFVMTLDFKKGERETESEMSLSTEGLPP